MTDPRIARLRAVLDVIERSADLFAGEPDPIVLATDNLIDDHAEGGWVSEQITADTLAALRELLDREPVRPPLAGLSLNYGDSGRLVHVEGDTPAEGWVQFEVPRDEVRPLLLGAGVDSAEADRLLVELDAR